ncbi:hypothetical protein LWI29_000509 [Acer saccharum]|uniref:Uncharacterized protein n=1 Tax=Acer saccharum TaxID=4024 RepID=A0AA39SQ48_ACESA|nr:hypothetical protein LWI29_000509 [Acer saccharum]
MECDQIEISNDSDRLASADCPLQWSEIVNGNSLIPFSQQADLLIHLVWRLQFNVTSFQVLKIFELTGSCVREYWELTPSFCILWYYESNNRNLA